MTRVSVIGGSKSDEEVLDQVSKTLSDLGVDYEVKILSAHRNRVQLEEYVASSDAEVFIAVAGLAAHLPGAIASLTVKPVIGVPVSKKLGGLDSLLSIVQMPPGVPVATVGLDNGKNGAILAAQILSIGDKELASRVKNRRAEGR